MIDLHLVDPDRLPDESAIAAITLAELAAGPHATEDPEERARPGSAAVGRGNLGCAALRSRGGSYVWPDVRSQQAAGQFSRARLADLLIASTAAANGLPLCTRNPSDFAALENIATIVAV